MIPRRFVAEEKSRGKQRVFSIVVEETVVYEVGEYEADSVDEAIKMAEEYGDVEEALESSGEAQGLEMVVFSEGDEVYKGSI